MYSAKELDTSMCYLTSPRRFTTRELKTKNEKKYFLFQVSGLQLSEKVSLLSEEEKEIHNPACFQRPKTELQWGERGSKEGAILLPSGNFKGLAPIGRGETVWIG